MLKLVILLSNFVLSVFKLGISKVHSHDLWFVLYRYASPTMCTLNKVALVYYESLATDFSLELWYF